MARAILIDTPAKQIRSITIDVSDGAGTADIKAAIGCEWIESVRLGQKTVCWVDEEGLLKENPGPFFQIEGKRDPIAGRGLITGVGEGGATTGTGVPVSFVEKMVTFPDVEFSHFEEITEEDVEIFPGLRGVRISKNIIFKPAGKKE